VAAALHEPHGELPPSPERENGLLRFRLHDHRAGRVEVWGSWNEWRGPALACTAASPGWWQSEACAIPAGRHAYKFVIDGGRWLDDPANPRKEPDGQGGFNSVFDAG
jgi:1,4-alpha-glucan branching enzyme